jgi:hypothetical protein
VIKKTSGVVQEMLNLLRLRLMLPCIMQEGDETEVEVDDEWGTLDEIVCG